MTQFQINKAKLSETRLVEDSQASLGDGEILLKIEKFGLSTNNITYAVAGETLQYWKFFKPAGENSDQFGIMPVWGFAEVINSNVNAIPVGDRLFGYFPPADTIDMKPVDVSSTHLFDGSEHRSELPRGYNVYRRVNAEPGYDPRTDEMRMLLYPLYLTSYVIADQLKELEFYGAEAVLIVSASSKTSIGLAYALQGAGKKVIGLTSAGNAEFVSGLGIYDEVITYDKISSDIPAEKCVIVDMAGNGGLLGQIHQLLGDNMCQTLSVGLTHWDTQRRSSDVIKDRTEFFFAPSQIQKLIKQWGPEEFDRKSSGFVLGTAGKSLDWLVLKNLDGLGGLAEIYPAMLDGKADPRDGYLVQMSS